MLCKKQSLAVSQITSVYFLLLDFLIAACQMTNRNCSLLGGIHTSVGLLETLPSTQMDIHSEHFSLFCSVIFKMDMPWLFFSYLINTDQIFKAEEYSTL